MDAITNTYARAGKIARFALEYADSMQQYQEAQEGREAGQPWATRDHVDRCWKLLDGWDDLLQAAVDEHSRNHSALADAVAEGDEQ